MERAGTCALVHFCGVQTAIFFGCISSYVARCGTG